MRTINVVGTASGRNAATATPIVYAGDGQTLIQNLDPNFGCFLSFDNSIDTIGLDNAIPLNPNGSYVVDGKNNVYAIGNFTTGSIQLAIIPGGMSFFRPASLSALGGISVFIQPAAPTQPPTIPVNSIWLKTSGPNVIAFSTWNGAAWVAQSFDASGVIAVGTVIANLIAAGTIVAGIVNGTTITGAQFIAQGAAGEILVYSGPAAAGNLVASISAVAFTDSHGNAVLDGIVAYQQGSPSTAIRLNVTGQTLSTLQAASFAGPWAIIGSISNTLAAGMSISATGGLTLNGPTIVKSGDLTTDVGRNVVVGGVISATAGVRATPTVITTDTWTTFAAFGAGFGAGGIAPQQALMPHGVGGVGSVKLRGQILSTAATAANSTMVTAIGGPTQNMSWIVPTNANGYAPGAGTLPRVVTVDTAGNVRLQPSTSAANQFVLLDGIEYPLG